MRNQFTFYKSFDDVIEDLTDKQIAEYMKVMLDVQFLRLKIEDVEFDDKILAIVWKSQKHSIEKSVQGYLDGQKREGIKNPYLGVYAETKTPYEGGRQQEEEQEKEKEEGKGEEQEKGQYVTASAPASEIKEIISHLNEVTNSHYKQNASKTKTLIQARLKEGYTVDDFKKVHIAKYSEWVNTDFEKFLRPETLYSNKFESYLNQKISDYDKTKAIANHTGVSQLQLLKQQGCAV